MPRSVILYLEIGGLVLFLFVFLLVISAMTEKGISTISGNGVPKYHIVSPQPVTLITEPDDGIAPIRLSIAQASTSVDMVMYELQDQEVEQDLAAAAGRGVIVRVLLNAGFYGKASAANQSAFNYLQSNGVHVKWSPSYFALTHQKTLIIDAHPITRSSKAIIMTLNLVPKYYTTARDFAVEDPDPADVAAIEETFSADWNNTQSSPQSGDDLVWSPGSKQILLAMIASARKSLLISTEELEDADSIKALAAAAGRGVHVELLMTDSKKWHAAFDTLTAAGVVVRIYEPKATLYIHEKILIVDGTQAFVGSENLTTTSLMDNRELGLLISTPAIVEKLETVFAHDWGGFSDQAE